MGIKSLNPFLKEKCPQAFRDIPYSHFKGKRVAVDSDNVLMKLMSRSHKEIVNQTDVCAREPDRQAIVDRWLHHIKEEVNKFLKFGITLIFVFDGKYIDEKSETQTKRKEAKKKLVDAAADKKQEVMSLDELERTPQMVTELRKKMHHLGKISMEEKKMVAKMLSELGFPVLYATEEGEKLCAMLAIEGLVDCVYSKDTDVVAMGCPLCFNDEAGWVYNSDSGKTEMSVKSIDFRPILGALKMEYDTFLDLCIMAGCDFNSNIPQLAVKKAYKLLVEHGNIDSFPESYNEKKEILNHIRCREIFCRQKAADICQSELILNMNLDLKVNLTQLEEHVEFMQDWMRELKMHYLRFPTPSNIFIQKVPSQNSSRIRLVVAGKKEDDGNEEKVTNIPKQKASPKKMTQKGVQTLNLQQLEKFKARMSAGSVEKDVEKPKIKLVIS